MDLYTPRLRLTAIGPQHAPLIFRHFTQEIVRYMEPSPPADTAQAERIIAGWQQAAHDNAVFAIERRGSFCGLAGLHSLMNAPEAGLWLKREAQGHGYGREAFSALRRYAASRGIAHLRYPVDCRNLPSRRIATAFGGVLIQPPTPTPTEDGRTLMLEVYRIPCPKCKTAAD